MMGQGELVSVLVPVYNVAQYVRQCLESIEGQTYRRFECVVIDDGSTDSSREICDEFPAKDSRFKVIHQDNKGLGFARNTGLDVASGDYILFVDSDDVLTPNALETALALISSGPYDVAMFRSYCTDKVDSLSLDDLKAVNEEKSPVVMTRDEAMRLLLVNKGHYCPVWNKLYTRRVIGDLRFTVPKVSEDAIFNMFVFQRMDKMIMSGECLYILRDRPGSITKMDAVEWIVMEFYNLASQVDCEFTSERTRGYYLNWTYGSMQSSRFRLLGTPDYQKFMKSSREFRKKTFREFLSNPVISFGRKAIVTLVWPFPHLGRFVFNLIGN